MPKFNQNGNARTGGRLGVTRRLVGAAVFGVLVIGPPMVDAFTTKGEIYANIHVGPIALGGQSPDDAHALLTERLDAFRKMPFTFFVEDLTAALPLDSVISFASDQALAQAQAIGNSGSSFNRFKERARARISGVDIPLEITINKEVLTTKLREAFALRETQPQHASFAFSFEEETPTIQTIPEIAGVVIDIERALQDLTARAQTLTQEPFGLTLIPVQSEITQATLETLQPNVQKLLNRPPLAVSAGESQFTVSPQTFALWIEPAIKDDHPVLQFKASEITQWLDIIAKEVERAPEDAVFELAPDGKKVTKFSIGKPGVQLPRAENVARMTQAIMDNSSVTLLLTALQPKTDANEDALIYGIRELVSRATTNFKGSPPNRIKNIKRGAAILDGTLIAPDEEFSLLDHLQPFTRENGYLPELVIKAAEGKTVPEIGGGLCQIGTTMFRTVLNAGLPITARRNHSYRVSYYEPPVGMDATIYDPAPDFKFINDTGKWLVLVTQVKGTELTFELWGTKDGRKVEMTDPVISNIKQPPEKKIIETTELPLGITKCTERAHIGSDARFTYTVTYHDGTVKEEEFFSRYRPWQEVCLVGVETMHDDAPSAPEVPTAPATPSDTLPSADVVGVVGAPEVAPQN